MKTATRILALFALIAVWCACDRPTPVAPSESTLTITGNPTRITIDGVAVITILARKADGTAVNPGTEINFATNLGTIDTVAFTDDRGVAEATLRGDGRIGLATVTADSGAAMSATIDIQIGALASSISFTANPLTINKDLPPGGERIKLKATVYDDLNNAIPGVAVIFEADTGTLDSGGSVETNNKGVARDTLTVREVRNFPDGFVITARTAGAVDEVVETVDIDVVGFAFDISLTVTPTSIPVTGGIVRLAALVRDDFGDAAVGENVNFVTELGSLASGGALIPTSEGGQAFDTLTITEADLASLGNEATGITVSAEVFTADAETPIVSDEVTIVLQVDAPIAGFDFEVVGLTVNFTNTTTGDPTLTYEWDFGDGGTSTSENPGNTYVAEGTYPVSLTATNLGGSDTITKDVVVAASADLSASPTSINFGTVANPGTADRILTISNAGGATLTITGVTSSNAVFSVISGVPGTLAPGDSANVTLRFTPGVVAANTAQSGILTITSNDPGPPATVALSGTETP